MPPGWIGRDQVGTCHFIAEELAAGHCLIIKQDLQSGGKGNVVLSAVPGVRVAGTKLPLVVLPCAADIAAYLDARWAWLTDGGQHSIVIERYFTDAVPFFAEFFIDDAGIRLTGHGEMLMTPTYAGVIAPSPRLDPAVMNEFIETAKRIGAQFRAIGYRGTASVDAVLTAGDRFWLSEINCRMGGSSHLHSAIGAHVVGPSHRSERLVAERDGWRVPSFREAVHRLEAAGLAYDPETRLGVILTCDVVPANGTVKCCVVAEDLDAVKKYELLLGSVFLRLSGGALQASERLGEDGFAVGVAAPLLHVGQVGLVGLNARGGGRVLLIRARRVTTARALPGVGNRGIGREAGPCLVLVRAPERDPDTGRGLAALSLSHRPRANPAAADGVATTHRSPLDGCANERACGKEYVRRARVAGKSVKPGGRRAA
jgi:hypothetical protein